MKHKGKKVIDDVKGDFIQKWEEKSNEFIRTFLMLFGRENLSQIWDKSKGRIKDVLHKRSPSRDRNLSDNDEENIRDSPPAKRSHRIKHYSITSDESDEEVFDTASGFPSISFKLPSA
jgi:choline-phosphate cytidylyltransferase